MTIINLINHDKQENKLMMGVRTIFPACVTLAYWKYQPEECLRLAGGGVTPDTAPALLPHMKVPPLHQEEGRHSYH